MLKAGSRARMLLVLTAAMFSAPAQADEPPALSVIIDGPGFMGLLHHVRWDRLVRAETGRAAAHVTFRNTSADQDVEITFRVDSFGSDYIRHASPAPGPMHERIFRNDASAFCERPVQVSRSSGLPNVAADGAVPVRLEAVCDAPKDRRWEAVYFVAEFLTNGTTMCRWNLRQSSRSSGGRARLPMQDVCTATAVGGGETAVIQVIR